jgi:hypothetical protein
MVNKEIIKGEDYAIDSISACFDSRWGGPLGD